MRDSGEEDVLSVRFAGDVIAGSTSVVWSKSIGRGGSGGARISGRAREEPCREAVALVASGIEGANMGDASDAPA